MNNLYNTYCPKSLNEVVGHKEIVSELQKRAEKNNFSQCMYFTGMSGIGKTVLAHIVAKHLLCENKINNEPCNECFICRGIDNQESVLNYTEICSSSYGKDEIIELIDKSFKKVGFTKDKKKVIFINELQEIKSRAGEKTLLMALERPSTNTYWILASMDDDAVDKAIKNRCAQYYLKPIKVNDIVLKLNSICELEKIGNENKEVILKLISEHSGGSLRQAISILERIIYGDLWTEGKGIF